MRIRAVHHALLRKYAKGVDIYKRFFGERLRTARSQIPGLTQEGLGEACGVEPSSVSRWETGRDFPEDHRMAKICAVLKVDLSYFEPAVNEEKPTPKTVAELPIEEFRAVIETIATRKFDKDPLVAGLKKEVSELKAQLAMFPKDLHRAWKSASVPGRAAAFFFLTGDERALEKAGEAFGDKMKVIYRTLGLKRRPQL